MRWRKVEVAEDEGEYKERVKGQSFGWGDVLVAIGRESMEEQSRAK